MTIRKIITAVSAAVILAPAAFGATTPAPAATPAAQCESLQKQYQTAADCELDEPERRQGQEDWLRGGEKLCKEGKPADGVKKLEHALKELGVKAQ